MYNYLVLCDLDDTLLTSDKLIKDESINFIRNYIDSNNLFILCTGRPYQACINYYNEISKKVPLICDNGCSIYLSNNESIFIDIDISLVKEIFIKLKNKYDSSLLVTSKKITYSYNYNNVPDYLKHNELNDIRNIDGIIEDIISINPLIINIWLKEEYLNDILRIKEEYKDLLDITIWDLYDSKYGIEIRNIKGTKGNALKILKEKYNIKDDHTIAFGDQKNDLSMLKEAYLGVAMINSNKEIKKEVKYVTKYDNNSNGVIKYLKDNNLY